MMRSALALLTLAISTGCGPGLGGNSGVPPLPAGVRVFADEDFYDVRGLTVDEIRRSIREGAAETPGGRFSGLHSWSLSWTFRYASRPACHITTVEVEIRSTIRLPRWVDREDAEPELVRQWDTYFAALRTHEFGHRRFSYLAARDIQRTLRRMSAPACGILRSRANQRAREILEAYRRESRAFDRETRHGATQGATWPPTAGGDGGIRRPGAPQRGAFASR